MKRHLALVIVILCLLPASRGESKLDPMQIITDQLVQPDVLIILDNSSSMAWRVSDSTTAGTDCSGAVRAGVDLAHDGVCSAYERLMPATTSGGNCRDLRGQAYPNNFFQDCPLYAWSHTYRTGSLACTGSSTSSVNRAGEVYPCNGTSMSRMFMVKRVLQSIVPALKSTANLGLVAFSQDSGTNKSYYRYVKAFPDTTYTSPAPAKPTTFFLTLPEMKLAGAWADAPATRFKWTVRKPQADGTITTTEHCTAPLDTSPPAADEWDSFGCKGYTLLSSFPSVRERAYLDSQGVLGATDYPSAAAKVQDSLYVNQSDSTDEKRFAWAGLKFDEAGPPAKTWLYKGSYYTYLQKMPVTASIAAGSYTCQGLTGAPAMPSPAPDCTNPGSLTAAGRDWCCWDNGVSTCGFCPSNMAATTSTGCQVCTGCPGACSDAANCRDCPSSCLIGCDQPSQCRDCSDATAWDQANCRTCPNSPTSYRWEASGVKECGICLAPTVALDRRYPGYNEGGLSPTDKNNCKECRGTCRVVGLTCVNEAGGTEGCGWTSQWSSKWQNKTWSAAQWQYGTWNNTWQSCTRVTGTPAINVAYLQNWPRTCASNNDCSANLGTCSGGRCSSYLPKTCSVNADCTTDVGSCSGGQCVQEWRGGFNGPQFTIASGTWAGTWVYHRFYYGNDAQNSTFYYSDAAKLLTSLSRDTTQAPDPDYLVAPIMSWLNDSRTGGMRAWQETPTGKAVQVAHQHFIHKAVGNCSDQSVTDALGADGANYPGVLYPASPRGTCPFNNVADDARACRPRIVIVLTDGEWTGSLDPADAAVALYRDTTLTADGAPAVRTFVVGLPGLATGVKLKELADAGYDGVKGNIPSCCCPNPPACNPTCTTGSDDALKCHYVSSSEDELRKNIIAAIYAGMKGEYATAQGSVATSSDAVVASNIALVASTSFPDWRGHLRAWDVGAAGGVAGAWGSGGVSPGTDAPGRDAGQILADQYATVGSHVTRPIYTGYPGSSGGSPVPFYLSGALNPSLASVWSTATGAAPLPADFQTFISWLAGDRTPGNENVWPLGPMFRMTPAVVGPAPTYPDTGNHDKLEAAQKSRPTLAYVATNLGVLHAFRLEDPTTKSINGDGAGTEVFAYVPPNLLPRIYELYKQNDRAQDPDPTKFKWILASSPRVEDIPRGNSSLDAANWRTQLVLTMGPSGTVPASDHHGEHFVVLDITDPTAFKVLAHSQELTVSGTWDAANYLGETWSIPVFFYDRSGTELVGKAAMGSGYSLTAGLGSCARRGDNYLFFPADPSPPTSNELWGLLPALSSCHDRAGKQVPDWGLVADTAAAIDVTTGRKVVATYQADLNGRVMRYALGDPGSSSVIINQDVDNPFYYAPAVYLDSTYSTYKGHVTLAANSGSFDETNAPDPTPQATLYLRTEKASGVGTGNKELTCRVDQICSNPTACGAWTPPPPPNPLPTGYTTPVCEAPASTENARPVSSPFLLDNQLTTGHQLNAYFLLQTKDRNTKCGIGHTYFVRLKANKVDLAVPTDSYQQQVVAAKKLTNTRTSGMTVVLGGKDVIFTKSGVGTAVAKPELAGKNVGFAGLSTSQVIVETWREIR